MCFKVSIKLIFIFIIFTGNLSAQYTQGIITNAETQEAVPYVQLLNLRTSDQAVSDMQGKFRIKALQGDTLKLSSLGYHSCQKAVLKSDTISIMLFPVTYNLDQVNVYDNEYIPQIYRSDVSFNKKPTVLQALVSPVSFLYYKFSKRERNKREARELMRNEHKMANVRKIYTKELVAKLTGFTGEKLDDCFIFCNLNIELLEGDDEFSIKYKLLVLIAKYRQQ